MFSKGRENVVIIVFFKDLTKLRKFFEVLNTEHKQYLYLCIVHNISILANVL